MRAYIPILFFMVLVMTLAGPAAGLVLEGVEDDDLAELEAQRLEKITETLEVLQAKGDVAGMIALYRKGLAISPSNLTARERYTDLGVVLAGYALSHKGDPAQVLELLDEFEAYAGDEFRAPSALWWFRATALRRLGRADEADALRQKALDLRPGDSDYHRRVGYFLLTADLYEEAITEFETARAAAENDWVRGMCTWAIAASHLKVEQYEKAADEYEKAIEFFKNNRRPRHYETLLEDASLAMHNLGRYHELRGHHKQTIAANERALKLIPAELGEIATRNLTAIGDAYLKLRKPKKALEYLERARVRGPNVPGVYSSLGDAYRDLGDDARAQEAYEECERLYRDRIATRPNRPPEYNNLAWFFVTHDMKLDEALKLSRTSVEMSPETDAYLDTLAEIYHRMGEHDKAIEWINKALELDPKPHHLIYFEQQLKKFEHAKKKGT